MNPSDFINKNKSNTGLRITDVIREHQRSGTLDKSVQFNELKKPASSTSSDIKIRDLNFFQRTADDYRALRNGEFSFKDVVKEIPKTAIKQGIAVSNFVAPAITNFFDTTGSIFGEGMAYAFDKNVREQYKAGNMEILPTISETTLPKLAKYTIATGIETAIFRSIPNVARARLGKLGLGAVGALEGVGFAISEGLAKDETPEEILKKMPLYGVTGGALAVLTPYLVPILRSEIKHLPKEIKQMITGLEKSVPEPPARMLDVQTAESSPTAVPVSTPKSRYAEYLRKQGYEPYTPDSQLPAIEMGTVQRKKSLLPTVQIGDDVSKPLPPPPGTRLVPEPKTADGVPTTARETPETLDTPSVVRRETTTPRVEATDVPTVKVPSRQLPVGDEGGVTKASRLENRIVRDVTDPSNPKPLDPEKAAMYQTITKKEQMSKAVKYVDENSDDAMAVLRGEKDAPEGLLDNSIALALAKKAELNGDSALAIRLASLRSTRAGQEISMLTEADPMGVVSQIEEIVKARKSRAGRAIKGTSRKETVGAAEKQATQVKKQATTAVDTARLKIADAEKLLNDILC